MSNFRPAYKGGDPVALSDIDTSTWGNGNALTESISKILANFNIIKALVGANGAVTVAQGGTGKNTALTGVDIVNIPAGGISASTVQAALNELDTEKLSISNAFMSGYKNKIINGCCRVAQEGNKVISSNTNAYGGADRIKGGFAGFTHPSQFPRNFPSAIPSRGFLQMDFGGDGFSIGSQLYTMNVSCPNPVVKYQAMRVMDDYYYIYLNGNLIASGGSGEVNSLITYNFISGVNTIEFVSRNTGGRASVMLVGDIIDNVSVKFYS